MRLIVPAFRRKGLSFVGATLVDYHYTATTTTTTTPPPLLLLLLLIPLSCSHSKKPSRRGGFYLARSRSGEFQCIVISLKDMFYENANALVGICRDAASNGSCTLTLDLDQYDEPHDEEEEEEEEQVRHGSRRRRAVMFIRLW